MNEAKFGNLSISSYKFGLLKWVYSVIHHTLPILFPLTNNSTTMDKLLEILSFLPKESVGVIAVFGALFYLLYLFYKSSERRLDKLFEDKQTLFQHFIESEESRFEKLMQRHSEEEMRRYKALEKLIETQQMTVAILARVELKVDTMNQKIDGFGSRIDSLHIETLKALNK
jgi:hypothetical protein